MADYVIGVIPENTILKRMGLCDRLDGGIAPFLEFETPDGTLTRRVMVLDYTQPTGYRIEDTVVTLSADFSVSIGTLDAEPEQT